MPDHLPIYPGNWQTINDILAISHNPDGTLKGTVPTSSTAATQAAINAALTGKLVFPGGSYTTDALTTLIYSKLEGAGTTLKPSGNSMTVLTLKSGSTLGDSDYLLVRNLFVDGTGKTGITGFDNDGGASSSVGSAVLENLIAANCDTVGINLRNAQFLRGLSLRAAHCGTGMLIANDATSGGANSIDLYGLHVNYNTVGLVVNGTHYIPVNQIDLYNPQMLGNTVCGMAFFAADVNIYGGAPELNATGAATAVVDGQTVKKSDIYANNSTVRLIGYHATTQVTPSIIAENNSIVSISDLAGYGLGADSGILVQCDATSTVSLHGALSANGLIQNVAGWPNSWILPASAQSAMYGTPVSTIDRTLPVLFGELTPLMQTTGSNQPTISQVTDTNLGACTQIVYNALVGSTASNFAYRTLGSGAASQDTVVSLLVKASVDCQVSLDWHDGTSLHGINPSQIFLKAGKVTRIIAGRRNIAANGTWLFYLYPVDTTGPTIKISQLQVYQGATGTATTTAEIAKIVSLGAFNPGKTDNGGTSTQTPGAVTVVNIAHGLIAAPRDFQVLPGDVNARGAPTMFLTADATNVILNFSAALTAATAYTWRWRAEV